MRKEVSEYLVTAGIYLLGICGLPVVCLALLPPMWGGALAIASIVLGLALPQAIHGQEDEKGKTGPLFTRRNLLRGAIFCVAAVGLLWWGLPPEAPARTVTLTVTAALGTLSLALFARKRRSADASGARSTVVFRQGVPICR